jgi:hypothetical protein
MLRMVDVHIVYFAYLNPNVKYLEIIRDQLLDMVYSDLITISHLHVTLSGDQLLVNDTKKMILNLLHKYIDRVFFYENYSNQFEYQGILTLYKLGHQYPDKILLYLHTKGMSYPKQVSRHQLNIILTRHTIWHWNQILSIFKNHPNIKKICLFPGYSGYLFFNFYWIRGRYTTSCATPLPSSDRYFFEKWISLSNDQSFGDTYNLYLQNCDLLTYNITAINIRNLQIGEVFYGTDDYRVIITERFIERWSQMVHIVVNNELSGCDPALGITKKLTIIFLSGLTVSFDEYSTIDTLTLIESMMFDVRNLRKVYFGKIDISSRFIYFWANQTTISVDKSLTNYDQPSKLQLIYCDGHTQEFNQGDKIDTKLILTYIRDYLHNPARLTLVL